MSQEINDIEIVREYYELDRIDNKDLVRLEMNIIEFPIFSKSRKIKKGQGKQYIFNKEGTKYLEVVPTVDIKIPGEFEERIFLGLMNLLRESRYENVVYTNFYDLMSAAKITYSTVYLRKTKEALDRCANTSYRFKDIFYISPTSKNEKGKIASRKVNTKMFDYEIISIQDADEKEKNYFRNKRMKEIIKIDFSSFFYENIIRKGYLYFDSEDLLSLENTTSRNIYTMITKWRNKKFYLKRYSKFIASRVPLSWENKNRSQTINIIIKAFEEIKEKGLIKDFNFNRSKKLDESFFEIFFDKKHNKNLFKTDTGQELLEISKEVELKDISKEKEKLVETFKNNKVEITKSEFEKELIKYAENMGYKATPTTLNSLRVPLKMKNNYKIIEEE